MSTADDAWQEWNDQPGHALRDDGVGHEAFMFAYRRALEDAQQVIAGENSLAWGRGAWGSSVALPHAIELIDDLIDSVGTKDGDDDE